MTHLVKGLLRKHEDLSSSSHNTSNQEQVPCNLIVGQAEKAFLGLTGESA